MKKDPKQAKSRLALLLVGALSIGGMFFPQLRDMATAIAHVLVFEIEDEGEHVHDERSYIWVFPDEIPRNLA